MQGARHNLVAKVWLLQHVRDQLLLLQAFDLNFRLIFLLGNKFENIATVQNCPDITILNALYFGLCLFDILSFFHFFILSLFSFLSFCHFNILSFLSFCLDIIMIKCLKSLKYSSFCPNSKAAHSQKSPFHNPRIFEWAAMEVVVEEYFPQNPFLLIASLLFLHFGSRL